MGIKSTKTEEATKGYPCLKISNLGQIVLFVEEQCGTLLNAGSTGDNIGGYVDGWNEKAFNLYNGDLTLSNE